MSVFYLIITVVSATALAVDIFLRFVEKVGNFGIDKRFFMFTSKTIPMQDFFPHSVSFFIADGLVFGASGLFFEILGIGYFSILCAFMCACGLNFCVYHLFFPMTDKLNGQTVPKGENIIGKKAVCTEFISGDGYGKVRFTYKSKRTEKNAVSFNDTDIAAGDIVYIMAEENDAWFVVKEDELTEVLNEKPNS